MCNKNQKILCSKLECEICYNRSFASHERSKNWLEGKNELTPRQVFKNSNKKHWFKCHECKHDFELALSNAVQNKFCPYCANHKLCDNNDCQSCYEKSFASHEKSKNCDKGKNKLTPRQVFKSSSFKHWFKCDKCEHEFEIQINNITHGNNFCPYCANKKLCDNNDCQSCYEKSFASHEKNKNWNKNKNKINPRQVFKGSQSKHWFNCFDCEHEFEIQLNSITGNNCFCSYCAHKKLCDNNDCQSCYEKSFASHKRNENWSKEKNTLTPRQVFKNSNFKHWFECDKCEHEFEIILYNITRGNQWCPYCKNKTEKLLHDQLLKYFQSSDVKIQAKFEWCKNDKTNNFLPFDFVIESQKNIIELDGPQHFSQVSNWKSPEENLERDKYKMECSIKNGYSVIRLLQEDVLKNNCNWEEELIKLLVKRNKPETFFLTLQIEKYNKHIITHPSNIIYLSNLELNKKVQIGTTKNSNGIILRDEESD